MIRVLIVDDSVQMRYMMRRALEPDPDFDVIAEAVDGGGAITAALKYKPDVITMDLMMPGMSGLEATSRIMEECPAPIVMVSAIGDSEEQRITFEGLEAGAVWVVPKPRGNLTENWDTWSSSFRNILKSMAEVKVVSRTKKKRDMSSEISDKIQRTSIIVIGTSTGGPTALNQIFQELPKDYPIPILVCQHIIEGFATGLVEWLSMSLNPPVRVAKSNAPIEAGITFAPDSGHLEIRKDNTLLLTQDESEDGYVPSADRLFHSAARFHGKSTVGIILTGMGRDGAEGMRALFETGSMTIAQTEKSSLIYGMPHAAVQKGAVRRQMDLVEFPAFFDVIAASWK
jgi:two-component system, chemotaxis family, protein-glutamate methylesterase/glutaminase